MEHRIQDDLRASYGLECLESAPVAGGWLNRKWRVRTQRGLFLVKAFSRERFGLRQLEDIEAALHRQAAVSKAGVICPEVLQCGGRIIRLLEDGTAYMVMAFAPGQLAGPDTITMAQMESLGNACGQLHAAFAQLPCEGVKGYPVDGTRLLQSLWENHHARKEAFGQDDPSGYREAVLAQAVILARLNPGFFDAMPAGICHEDFTSENLLFDSQGVTAILDFDRSIYTYTWHDVGRALLCFALEGECLDKEKIRAFQEGYARHRPLSLANIADALRLCWCIENPWWVQPSFFEGDHGKATRFRDEILWVGAHWDALEDLVGV